MSHVVFASFWPVLTVQTHTHCETQQLMICTQTCSTHVHNKTKTRQKTPDREEDTHPDLSSIWWWRICTWKSASFPNFSRTPSRSAPESVQVWTLESLWFVVWTDTKPAGGFSSRTERGRGCLAGDQSVVWVGGVTLSVGGWWVPWAAGL